MSNNIINKKISKIMVVGLLVLLLCGCGSNGSVTGYGGTKEIDIPAGYKFINYNIQSNEMIWCTYRPMREGEIPEVYIIQQDKSGIQLTGDGTFIIYETLDGVRAELPAEQQKKGE